MANRKARKQGEKLIEQFTGGLALVFIHLSREFRHAFRGSDLTAGAMSDAELYGYSICWLILAGIMLFMAVPKK